MASGVSQAQDGADSLARSIGGLVVGADQVQGGNRALKDKLTQLAGATDDPTLKAQLEALAASAGNLAAGAGQVSEGVAAGAGWRIRPRLPRSATLSVGASKVSDGATTAGPRLG